MRFNLLFKTSFLNFIFSLLVPFVSHTNELKYIFKSGSEGYNTFRIPSIITTDSGVVLAFAEGRKNSSSDSGDIDLVLKRSTDGGKTWSDLIVIRDDSTNVCGNPSPVIYRKTGKIFLLSTWNRGDDTESEIINMTSVDTRRVYVMNSIDEGLSWSKPIEITDKVKKPNWTWYATGPVHGIQIREGSKKGRMIIPCDHIEANTKKYYSHIIYSDDGGSSWNIGGTTPQDQVNECSVAEIGKGKLILNMRNYDRTQMNRKISISNDYGESWGDIYDDKALVEPICQASILRYSFKGSGRNDLLFINPADKNKRLNMTLRLSNDLGRTWTREFLLHKGPSAYSDITKLRNGNIGCLFEGGKNSPYEGIVYREVDVRDIN